jgi:hypothetical protein
VTRADTAGEFACAADRAWRAQLHGITRLV